MTHLDRENVASHHPVAEQQMRRWVLSQEIEQRLAEGLIGHREANQVHPYVALSRQAGTGASAIARMIGDTLEWSVVDRDLLSLLLGKSLHTSSELDAVDETSANWLIEVFGKWMSDQTLTQMEFVSRLEKILLAAAQERSCVFVGRGAQFVLPKEHGLSVRIMAPREARIAWARENLELSSSEARRWIEQHDRGRKDFVQKYFHHDVDDSRLYDLVVNLEHLNEADAAELIVQQCQRRFHGTATIAPR